MQEQNETCEIVMERSLNEHWGVTVQGEIEIGDFRGDGGASEFSNYACLTHDDLLETWDEVLVHIKTSKTPLATAIAEEAAE